MSTHQHRDHSRPEKPSCKGGGTCKRREGCEHPHVVWAQIGSVVVNIEGPGESWAGYSTTCHKLFQWVCFGCILSSGKEIRIVKWTSRWKHALERSALKEITYVALL
ncbi:hypothetical protein HanIR_Chr01g0034431 [Helianthus annuus]|nr:hypothetical protein HanIR_Chr01g0034431 [Helianthus annuus]